MNPVWNLRELSTFKTENLWIFGYLVMFRELRDLIIEGLHLLLLYGFLCVCAIGVVTIFIANVPKNSPEVIYRVTPTPEPIVQIVTAPREVEFIEICNRIDGCPVVKGVCESCEIVKR